MESMKTLTISGTQYEVVDEKARNELKEKQPKGNYLTEHQKIKTVNGQSLVGEGDIKIEGGNGGVVFTVDVDGNAQIK